MRRAVAAISSIVAVFGFLKDIIELLGEYLSYSTLAASLARRFADAVCGVLIPRQRAMARNRGAPRKRGG